MKRAAALGLLAPLLLAAAPDRTERVEKPERAAVAEDPAEETLHTVKAGETLGGIARRAVVPRVLIIEANGLKAPYEVHAGQELVIPRRRSHVVKPGDTGFSIAYDYAVPWKDIATANGIAPSAPIRTGQRLVIPTISNAPASPAPDAAKPSRKDKKATAADSPDHPRFQWPAQGDIRRGFTPPGSRGAHAGVDILGDEADKVRAIGKGKVIFAGEEQKRYGNLVVIDHGNGWFSAYAKLQKVTVRKGDKVHAGQRVGLIGHTGETDNTELHFEIRHDNVPVDPLTVLPPRD